MIIIIIMMIIIITIIIIIRRRRRRRITITTIVDILCFKTRHMRFDKCCDKFMTIAYTSLSNINYLKRSWLIC